MTYLRDQTGVRYMTAAMDRDIEEILNTPGIGLKSEWNEIEKKWRDVLVSLVSNLSSIKRDDPEIHLNRTSIYQHADQTLTQIDGLLTALYTASTDHQKYLEPMGETEAASEEQLFDDAASTRNPYLVSTQCRCQHHDKCSSSCQSHTVTNLHTRWTNPLRVLQANFLPLDRLEAYYIQLANMMPDELMESEDDILQELTKQSKLGDGLKTKGDDFFHIQSKLDKAQRNAKEAMESKYKSLEGHLPNTDRVGFVRIYKEFWKQIFSKTTWTGPQQWHTERAKNLYRILKAFLEQKDPKSQSAKWFVEACPF